MIRKKEREMNNEESYPNDITREQFEIIRPILMRAAKTAHPRKYDLYDIFCAVLSHQRGLYMESDSA